jgi:hypothetical protein
MRGPVWRPLLLGSVLIGVQALLLTRTLGLYPDTTRINVVYNSRGLWSVAAVWLVGHWWGNTERHAGRAVLLWRLAGAALLLGAIVVAVAQPIDSRRAGGGRPARRPAESVGCRAVKPVAAYPAMGRSVRVWPARGGPG